MKTPQPANQISAPDDVSSQVCSHGSGHVSGRAARKSAACKAQISPSARKPSPAPPSRLLRHLPAHLVSKLLARAALIPQPEQLILESYFTHQHPIATIAARLSRHPRTIRTRLIAITTRLLSPAMDAVLTHHHAWPPEVRAIARAMHYEGLSIRASAKRLHIPLSRARIHAHTLRVLIASSKKQVGSDTVRSEQSITPNNSSLSNTLRGAK